MMLKKILFTSLRLTSFSWGVRSLLQLLQISILTRFLTPADFSIAPVVLASSSLMLVLLDGGLNSYLIYSDNLSQKKLSSIFWFTLVFATFLSVLLFFVITPFISDFYGCSCEDFFAPISLSLFFWAFGSLNKTIAQKKLNFFGIVIVEVLSSIFAFVVLVLSLYMESGVKAVSYSLLSYSAIGSLLSWLVLADGWRPSFTFNIIEVFAMIFSGIYMIGSNVSYLLLNRIDLFFGVKFYSPSEFGLYSVSKTFTLNVSTVLGQITNQVSLPFISNLRESSKKVKIFYLGILKATCLINSLIFIFLIFYSRESSQLIFGKDWEGASNYLKIFSAMAVARSVISPVGSLLLAYGKPNVAFKWNFFVLICTLGIVIMTENMTPYFMAFSLLIFSILILLPSWKFLLKLIIDISLIEFLSSFIIPVCMAIFSVSIGYELTIFYKLEDELKMAFGFFIAFMIYVYLFKKVDLPLYNQALDFIFFRK